jgi:tRNA(fMet)-specific endonuclease VapC
MTNGRRIRYVLDTDTTSAIQREHPTVKRRVADAGPGTVATTVVTLFEQMRGRLAAVNRARNVATLRSALSLLMETEQYFCENEVLPFDAASASFARSLAAQRLRIGTQDLWIAAITLAHDLVLVTSNRRDFERVPGLRIEDRTVE